MPKMTMVQALNMALKQEMEKDDRVVVLGEDVGRDGGVFRVTDGLIDQFGEERSLDTPLAESGIIGMSIGMALYGLRPVCEIQFSGFSYLGFHQIESHASRLRWRSQGNLSVPMVLRAPYGGGVRALEHHSESREAFWAHIPGLKMVIPSGPRNARALLISAIRDPDPVIFYEGKAIYRAFREEVPEEEETMEIGKAQVVREGKDLAMISYGEGAGSDAIVMKTSKGVKHIRHRPQVDVLISRKRMIDYGTYIKLERKFHTHERKVSTFD